MKRYLALAVAFSVIACGTDSAGPTAPGKLSTRDALLSLSRGAALLAAPLASPDMSLEFSALPIGSAQAFPVGNASVSVDGTAVPVFALAQHVVYPAGTCLETLLGIPNFTNPAACTSPPGGLTLILWQTNSAAQPPDWMLFVSADAGTPTFQDMSLAGPGFSDSSIFPPIGMYLERNGAMWETSGGNLTSVVTTNGQPCTAPRPLFAASATCALGSFEESGSMTFAPIEIPGNQAKGTHTVVISAQNISGMIQTVTTTLVTPFPGR